jgi:hypothetical protein
MLILETRGTILQSSEGLEFWGFIFKLKKFHGLGSQSVDWLVHEARGLGPYTFRVDLFSAQGF